MIDRQPGPGQATHPRWCGGSESQQQLWLGLTECRWGKQQTGVVGLKPPRFGGLGPGQSTRSPLVRRVGMWVSSVYVLRGWLPSSEIDGLARCRRWVGVGRRYVVCLFTGDRVGSPARLDKQNTCTASKQAGTMTVDLLPRISCRAGLTDCVCFP